MRCKKYLFIDRDGTLIEEPADFQVDSIAKFKLLPDVIPSLLKLKNAGFHFVMVSNQDGLGTASFPTEHFESVHLLMLDIFKSQGIEFEDIKICPHFQHQNCLCRKPNLGLVVDYLKNEQINFEQSFVIGDRQTDMELAKNMGIVGILISKENNWNQITEHLLNEQRIASISRKTNETAISATINLDQVEPIAIDTGIQFFNHMLEQLAKHGGFSLQLQACGDLQVDDHHLIEDVAIVLGETLRKALGEKRGLQRYGFLLPMDEALAQVAIDLSGRSFCQLTANFSREKINDFSTEMVSHFFKSLSSSLLASIHIEAKGENDHHIVESIFKAVGRSLRKALQKIDNNIPSTKGVL